MNAGAILGESGNLIRKFGRQVMEEDCCTLSQATPWRQIPPSQLGGVREICIEKMGHSYAEKIFCENLTIY